MLLQGMQPGRGAETVDDGHGAEIEQRGVDGGFLRGDEDAGANVALFANYLLKASCE